MGPHNLISKAQIAVTMKKFRIFFPALLLGFVSAGCDNPIFSGQSCTDIGCSDGVTITISEERPDSLSLTIYLNDDTEPYKTKDCNNVYPSCILGVENRNPAIVRVEAIWENGEFNKMYNPEYKVIQPNGRGCDPICSVARIEIDVLE